ncbi:MAG: RNA polymerase subunit sigma-70 [Flavobacteriales bacterium CG18_big_fil_WC_8_21_14_2_50_32_9]|nr:MAG: RNA polymerase subunit sigma-70 [Flavobacteriales bacterium CG18_big_fil_WC_8_21_14_2_50_32_9]
MFSICLRYTKNQEDAEDVFQQAFFLIYKNLFQLKDVEALSGWIKRIVVNEAIEFTKRKYYLRVVEPMDASLNLLPDNAEGVLSQMSTDELTNLIQQLPTGCREVFNMYVIDGFSHKEISEKLNISIGTSKSQLFDARKILKMKISINKRSAIKTVS